MRTGNPLDTWSTAGQLVDQQTALDAYDLGSRLNMFMNGLVEGSGRTRVRVVQGDLVVAGHLLLDWDGGLDALGLVVTGNLAVDGSILNRDTGGGPFLLVEGDTQARSILGSGAELRFCGDALVRDIVIGEYNDGTLRFDGRLSVPVAVTHDHDLVIAGGLDGRWLDPFNEGHDWSVVLHPAIPVPDGEGTDGEGFEIEAHLVPRLLAGLPVLRDDLPPLEAFPLARLSSARQEPAVSQVPARAAGLEGVMSAACSIGHTLLLKADASVLGWGTNRSGQLGNGTVTDADVQAPVRGPGRITRLACGSSHSLAVATDGTVWAWGEGASGQLGTGCLTENPAPAPVPGLAGVQGIAAGDAHSLAVDSAGVAWAWGSNRHGALGTEDVAGSAAPLQVHGLDRVVAVAAGKDHSLALTAAGEVWAWGRNRDGQLGDGSTQRRATPVAVRGLPAATAIAAGCDHSLAVTTDGAVWVWGCGSSGELGNGRLYDESAVPLRVRGLPEVIAVSAGTHCLALASDRTVWAWGANFDGQLGDGTSNDRPIPARVASLADVAAVSAGHAHSIAIGRDGSVWVWGDAHVP